MSRKPNNDKSKTTIALTVKYQCRFQRGNGHRKLYKKEFPPYESKTKQSPSIPRITKLLALAHYYQKQLNEGTFKNYAQIAQSAGVSRARITQIMGLTLLAPEIQKEILLMKNTRGSCKKLTEHYLREVLKSPLWQEQKRIWNSNHRSQE